jgi:hypothetical protein
MLEKGLSPVKLAEGLLTWEGLDPNSSPAAVASEYWRLKRGLDALPTRDLFFIFELLGVHVEHTARDDSRLAQGGTDFGKATVAYNPDLGMRTRRVCRQELTSASAFVNAQYLQALTTQVAIALTSPCDHSFVVRNRDPKSWGQKPPPSQLRNVPERFRVDLDDGEEHAGADKKRMSQHKRHVDIGGSFKLKIKLKQQHREEAALRRKEKGRGGGKQVPVSSWYDRENGRSKVFKNEGSKASARAREDDVGAGGGGVEAKRAKFGTKHLRAAMRKGFKKLSPKDVVLVSGIEGMECVGSSLVEDFAQVVEEDFFKPRFKFNKATGHLAEMFPVYGRDRESLPAGISAKSALRDDRAIDLYGIIKFAPNASRQEAAQRIFWQQRHVEVHAKKLNAEHWSKLNINDPDSLANHLLFLARRGRKRERDGEGEGRADADAQGESSESALRTVHDAVRLLGRGLAAMDTREQAGLDEGRSMKQIQLQVSQDLLRKHVAKDLDGDGHTGPLHKKFKSVRVRRLRELSKQYLSVVFNPQVQSQQDGGGGGLEGLPFVQQDWARRTQQQTMLRQGLQQIHHSMGLGEFDPFRTFGADSVTAGMSSQAAGAAGAPQAAGDEGGGSPSVGGGGSHRASKAPYHEEQYHYFRNYYLQQQQLYQHNVLQQQLYQHHRQDGPLGTASAPPPA